MAPPPAIRGLASRRRINIGFNCHLHAYIEPNYGYTVWYVSTTLWGILFLQYLCQIFIYSNNYWYTYTLINVLHNDIKIIDLF